MRCCFLDNTAQHMKFSHFDKRTCEKLCNKIAEW